MSFTPPRLFGPSCTVGRVWAWRVLGLAVALTVGVFWAAGDEVESRHYNYRWYRADSGLPESEVMGFAQTPDGYLWCATFNGLARFDGKRFVTFDPSNTPELPTDRLTALDLTSAGLLIRTEFGEEVSYASGRFKRRGSYKLAGRAPIDADEAGNLWFPCLTNDSLSWSPLKRESGLQITGRLSGPQISSDGYFYDMRDHKARRAATPAGRWEELDLSLPDGPPADRLWTVQTGVWFVAAGWLCHFDGKTIDRRVQAPTNETVFVGVREDSDKTTWLVGYHTDLYRIDARENVAREVLDLPWRHAAYTMTSLVDRENNVWVAVSGQGLLEAQPASMQRYGTAEGLKNDIVRTVAEDSEGAIWACTTRGVSIISSNGIENLQPESFQWMACRQTTPGEMWLAWYSSGLFVYTRTNHWRVTNVNNDLWEPPQFTFLHQDAKGLLWFGNSSGLFSYDGTNTLAAPLPVETPADARALAEGKDGALYAGCNGQGLFERASGAKSWRRFGRADGLESEQIYSLKAASDGALWLGTSGAGLARFDGRRFVFFRRWVNELPRTVTGIEEDDFGYLWLGSTRAIFRVKIADLKALADDPTHPVAFTEYGRSYGLPGAESVVGLEPSVVKGRDGRIWFATTAGVICFDPRTIPSNPLAPPVWIEAVGSVDSRVDLEAARPEPSDALLSLSGKNPRTLTIRPGVDPIEFEYTGLSFTAPENVQFRYRMEGLDTNWVRTHERKAVYQRLPPGQYTFRVVACNNDGVWNETGASLAIVQLPYFWETGWFKALVLGAVAALVYGAHWYRLKQLARVGRLRAQIAADLHDEVGSNMGAVVLNSDLLTMSPNLSPGEREQLTDIHRVARNTAQAVREISWFINPDFDFLDDMIVRMKEASDRLSNNCKVSFSGPQQAPRTRLALEFRRNVMAIYKEALTNAARHSGAKRIDVSVRLQSDRMEFAVRDDGRGFVPGQENGGQGLRNLRQRAAAVAGCLEIESKPGGGTTVRFGVEVD